MSGHDAAEGNELPEIFRTGLHQKVLAPEQCKGPHQVYGFCWDRSLEKIAFHRATWYAATYHRSKPARSRYPSARLACTVECSCFHKIDNAAFMYGPMRCRPVILELTDGKPQLREGVLIYEDWEHNQPTGGRLHSAREDWGHDSARFEVRDGRILCDQFLTFTYLDDVNPGDGGLACKDTRCFQYPGTSSDYVRCATASQTSFRVELCCMAGLPGSHHVAPSSVRPEGIYGSFGEKQDCHSSEEDLVIACHHLCVLNCSSRFCSALACVTVFARHDWLAGGTVEDP